MVLICSSLISDVEHLSLLDMSSLEKCLLRSFAHFLHWVIIFFLLSYMSSLYILDISRYKTCKYCLPPIHRPSPTTPTHTRAARHCGGQTWN